MLRMMHSIAIDRGLQLLGMAGLGMGGGFERLHYLLESAFDADGQLSIAFLRVGVLHRRGRALEWLYIRGAVHWRGSAKRSQNDHCAAAL